MGIQDKPATKDRILAVTIDLFLEKGYRALSLRDVARKAGLTPMAIYRHYADKNALFEALIEAGFSLYAGYLDIDCKGNEVEHLEALAGRVFDFALEKSYFFELIFLTPRDTIGLPGGDLVQKAHAPTYEIAHTAITACRDANLMRVDNVRHMTNDVLAWCVGFATFFLSAKITQDQDLARKQFRRGFKRLLAPYLIS